MNVRKICVVDTLHYKLKNKRPVDGCCGHIRKYIYIYKMVQNVNRQGGTCYLLWSEYRNLRNIKDRVRTVCRLNICPRYSKTQIAYWSQYKLSFQQLLSHKNEKNEKNKEEEEEFKK